MSTIDDIIKQMEPESLVKITLKGNTARFFADILKEYKNKHEELLINQRIQNEQKDAEIERLEETLKGYSVPRPAPTDVAPEAALDRAIARLGEDDDPTSFVCPRCPARCSHDVESCEKMGKCLREQPAPNADKSAIFDTFKPNDQAKRQQPAPNAPETKTLQQEVERLTALYENTKNELRAIIETAMLHITKMRSNHLDIDPTFLMNTLRPGSSMMQSKEGE